MVNAPQDRLEVRIARPDDREEFYALWEAGIQAQLGEGIVRTRGEARQVLTPLRPPTADELRRHGRIYHVGTEPSGENILDLEAPLPSAFADGFHDVEERHVLESVTSPVSVEPVSASPEALLLFRLNQRAARAVLENAVRSYGRDGGVLVPVRAPTRRETVENARVERPGDGGLAAGMALPSLFDEAYVPTAIRVRLTGRGTDRRGESGADLDPPSPVGSGSAESDGALEVLTEEESAEEQIA